MSTQLTKLFLDVEDVMILHNKSKGWAYDRLKDIINHYHLKPHQRVNIYHFCEYEGIPEEKFHKAFETKEKA